ncbi:BTB POZ [Fusarium pseudocircinatum]|uniref:BTB POZ n=1 Tax=Fusarium pseudocircinatum TaxID=56676 RepID=A0A8H5PYN3_9HYPO|nr:BTB POZ [Fusarium pseudocircinatum]
MKLIQYDQICYGDFKIVIRTSNARQVIPIVNTIPRPSSEVVDEDQTGQENNTKNEDDVLDELPSESGVARSVAEPEAESNPYPGSKDGKVGSVRGWNRLFFGKEDPREIEKKGFRLEIMVHEDTMNYFCGPFALRPAFGSDLEASVLEASDYGWDAVALGIIVSAIHGEYYHVPVKVGLELFVKIAIIADFMTCSEALAMASRVWLSNLDDYKAVQRLDSETLMLFYVSWVFNLD